MANLITAQEVIELAFAENSNMREESIPKTTIGIAEIKYIRPAFGAMYALLADKYSDFTDEFIKPALAYFVKCEVMSSIAIDMSNSGVAVTNPQYQNAASDKQRQRLYDSEMSKAKTLLDYALSHIAVHSEEFPDYSGPITKKSYRVGGIVLGNERVATSIMGEAFKDEYERYLREMQEINEVVIDATEDVSQALLDTNEAIKNTEAAKEVALAAAEAATTAKENAEKIIEETETAKENTERATTAAEKATEDTRNTLSEFNEQKDNYAQIDKRYPKLTAGFADNLVGRGEATPEEFVFQPTANDVSVQDGTARIKRVKGNSVVWNQMSTMPNITPNILADYFEIFSIPTEAKNHRYFIAFTDPNLCANSIRIVGRSEADVYTEYTIPYTSHAEAIFNISPHKGSIYVRAIANDGVTEGQFNDLLFVDLTKAFPDDWQDINTVEDFYARIPSGIDIHAYNEGEIISMNTEAIKTVGFNQWDEQWETGTLSTSTGNNSNVNSDTAIRMKNYMPIIPNTAYFNKSTKSASFIWALYYDENKNYIGYYYMGYNSIFTTPSNAHYMRSYTESGYGTTYNHDICINLSNTGRRNGEYEPYQTFTRELGVIKKYFPEGMCKAGSVADSIEWDSSRQKWVAVQRVGVVDLGTLTWNYGSYEGRNFFVARLSTLKTHADTPIYNSLMPIYEPTLFGPSISPDKSYFTATYWAYPDNVIIRDSSFTDANTFKAAMQGVKLYYELAEPIVTEIEGLPELDYLVWDFGTEEALSSVPSAPFKADIIYQFNAVDRIRENTLRLQQLEAMLSQMQAAFVSMTAQVNNEEV